MAERHTEKRGAAVVYEWAEAAAFAVVLVVLVFTFLFRVMGVEGDSMEPTLRHDDFILLSNLFYTPEAGDIVVIAPTAMLDVPIVKRVIATQGQLVDINFDTGAVFVDGAPLMEPYVSEPTTLHSDLSFPQTVPEGCIFVLGDNRNHSLDSRDSTIGMVDTRYVLGHALLRVLPPKDAGTIR